MASADSGKYALIDDLAAEFAARYRKGERPSLKEYIDRYPELADEIRELFPAMVEMEQVKEDGGPAVECAAPTPLPRQIGDYRIVREVGRGGMGVVYEAEQVSLGRRVALKVLPLHATKDGKALARFRREAKAAARLHHTNIVPVFEVGQDGDTCFYAMQFIHGQPLDQVVEELRRLRTESASPKADGGRQDAAPLRQVAHSLLTGQFLPQDLGAGTPPSEERPGPATTPDGEAPVADGATTGTARMDAPAVLPGQTDLSSVGANRPHYFLSVARVGQQAAQALAYAHARGVVHRDIKPSNLLLDGSGVVWVTDFGLAKTEDDGLTNPGDVVGTFRYMAPERFRGEGDGRTDVYALGLTLYELLVLRPAFDTRDRAQLLEQVQNEEPPRPRSLDRRIPRDLETILLKAIDKDPARRYASAEAMAEDLRRFLADEPVKARRVGVPERLWRWYRRNRAVASLTAAVLLLVLTVAVGSTAAAFRLGQEKVIANARLWESLLAQAQAKRMTRQPGQRFESLAAIQKAMKLPLPEGESLDKLRTEAIAALCLPDLEVAKEWDGWPTGSSGFAIDDAFERYARGDKDGNVSVRRIEDDAALFPPLPGVGPVADYDGLQFSPDGRFLGQVCMASEGWRFRLWKLDGNQPVLVIETAYFGFAFRPDSRQCAVGSPDGSIRFCDSATGQESHRLNSGIPGPELQMRWNPKRPQLLVGNRAAWRVVDVDTGRVVREQSQPGGCSQAHWHPEGRLLAVSSLHPDRKIYLWDTQTGQLVLPPLEGHRNGGVCMRFSRRGHRLVSNDWSGILRLWDVHTGRQLLAQPAAGPESLHFGPDDRLLAGDLLAPRVRLFRCCTGSEFRTIRRPVGRREDYEVTVALSADGRLLAVCTLGGVALVDMVRGEEVALLPLPNTTPLRFEGAEALWTCGQHGLLRWPVRTGPGGSELRVGPPQSLSATGTSLFVACDGSGRLVATPNHNQGAILWDREANRTLVLGPQDDVRHCAVSRDGRWVATGSHGLRQGAGAKVWDARTGQWQADLPVGAFCQVGFSPDGKWLVTTSGGVRLWEVGTWREGPALGGWGASHVTFSADGQLLALGDDAPGVVRLVVPDTGREVARLTGPEQTRLAPRCFTPDGTRLITFGAETMAVYVFDLGAIREGLRELDLDWDAPPLPAALAAPAEPLQVRVELGDLEDNRIRRENPTIEQRALVALNSVSLALQPLNWEAYRQRGRAFAWLGEHRQAIDDFTAALLLMRSDHPARPELLGDRAVYHLVMGDLPRARADLEGAEKLDPSQGKSLRPRLAAILSARAMGAKWAKDHRAALVHLEQALTIAPDHPDVCNDLAWLLLIGPPELRDPARALPLARKAVERVAPQATHFNTLGVALYRSGLFAEAVPILEKSLETSKGQSDGFDLFILAMCHHRRGDGGRAKDCYDRAVRWFKERRDKLPTNWAEELTAFQVEAEALFRAR